jgi:hypothetical protein
LTFAADFSLDDFLKFNFMINIRFVWVVVLFAFIACRGKNEAGSSNAPVVVEAPLPADFEVFYQRFHSDSLFQMERITWPLAGSKGTFSDSTQTSVAHVWTRDQWKMHRNNALNSDEFIQKFFPIGDVIVVEKIYARGGPYGIEKRYARQTDQQWALIFYADLHEMR